MKTSAKSRSGMSRTILSLSACTVLLALIATPVWSHEGHDADDRVNNNVNNNNINVNVNTGAHQHAQKKPKKKKQESFFKLTSSIGFGTAKPKISSNAAADDHDGSLGLSVGIGTIASFSRMFHLTATGDYIFGKGSSSESESRTLVIGTGFIIGKVKIPGNVYFSGSSGPARTSLSNEFFGSRAPKGDGRAYKMALGRVLDKNTRVELSYLNIKDKWNDREINLTSGDYEYKSFMLHFVHGF